MSGTKSAGLAGAKRKRDPSKPERRTSHAKSRRTSAGDEGDNGDNIQADIALLEAKIIESRKHYNNIATLVQLARQSQPESDGPILAAVALCRVFSRLLATGDMTRTKGMAETEVVVVSWLRERYHEFIDLLLDGFLRGEHPPQQSVALTLVMRLVKEESKAHKDYTLKSGPMPRLVQTLLSLPLDDLNREEFVAKYFSQFDDIRFQTFQTIK